MRKTGITGSDPEPGDQSPDFPREVWDTIPGTQGRSFLNALKYYKNGLQKNCSHVGHFFVVRVSL